MKNPAGSRMGISFFNVYFHGNKIHITKLFQKNEGLNLIGKGFKSLM